MNFSESEIKILLNIIQKDNVQNGGSYTLSDDESMVIGKMKLKYGDDYVNQLNIIKNKYNEFVGGSVAAATPKTGSWLSRNTGVSAKPLKESVGQAISSLFTAGVTTGVAIGTAKMAEQQALAQKQQQEVSQQVQQQELVPALPKDELTLLKEENLRLKEENEKLKRENDELKLKVPIQVLSEVPVPIVPELLQGGAKIIFENTLYTIDSISE